MIKISKLDTFAGHRDSVYALISSRYPNRFFSAGADGLVVEWDLDKPDLGSLVARVGGSIYAMALNPSDENLWIGQNFDGIQVISPDQNKQLIGSVKITSSAIFDIRIFDGKAYVAFGDGVIGVMDIESMSVRKHVKLSDKSVRSLDISHDGKHLAVGLSDASVRILDRETMIPLYSFQSHTSSVFSVAYSPDGNFLLSAGRDARFKVWNVRSDYAMIDDVVGHMYAINHIAFSPKGDMFATCSMDKSIKLWDAASFRLLKVIDRSRHAGHGTSVNKLLWSSHQNLLISASDDRMISVWEVKGE